MGSQCIPLTGTTACPAFANASFSLTKAVTDDFGFLKYVSNVEEFDKNLEAYVHNDYVKTQYQNRFGCSDIDLSNTTLLYARYSISVICNGIVQASKGPCDVANEDSRPLCADTCAEMARNEELIVANPELCGTPNDNYIGEIRSDFTICSNPEESLGSCIEGSENEPDECGFGPNLLGLCGYCAASSPNSTDSCCSNSDATTRCSNVELPTTPSTPPLFPSDTSTSSSTPAASDDGGLSGGQIAGIVVGSVAGAAVIGALIAFLIIFWRRRQRDDDTIFNQPSPQYRGGPASPASREKNESYDLARGGRVARMSALQSHPEDPPHAAGAVAGKFHDSSDSEPYSSGTPGKSKRRPPVTTRRNGSLSSASVLAGDGDAMSPNSGSGGQYSSPEGVTSQSEQLPYFRDYYSEDDIHPNDKVAVLWAYQPRAGDEFELERGEMLKVVGIWDDGWATGVRLNERAEDYDGIYRPQRDSGVSNGSERRGSSPPPTGEIKAFPLVCVCVPDHWKKTIEADGYDGAGPGSPPI